VMSMFEIESTIELNEISNWFIIEDSVSFLHCDQNIIFEESVDVINRLVYLLSLINKF